MKLKPLAANMTELELNDGVSVLFSYQTPVAYHMPGVGSFKTSTRYSNTTTRHINKWAQLHGLDPKPVEQAQVDRIANTAQIQGVH